MAFQAEFKIQRNKSSLLLGLGSFVFVTDGRRWEGHSSRQEEAAPAQSQVSSPVPSHSLRYSLRGKELCFLVNMPLLILCFRVTGLCWLQPPALIWVLHSSMIILWLFQGCLALFMENPSTPGQILAHRVRELEGFMSQNLMLYHGARFNEAQMPL